MVDLNKGSTPLKRIFFFLKKKIAQFGRILIFYTIIPLSTEKMYLRM